MKSPSVRFLSALVAFAVLGAGQVRADFADYSYQWSVEPTAVIAGGTGTVTLAVGGGSASSLIGDSAPTLIPVAAVTTSSTAPPETPDYYQGAFDMKLTLTDAASGASGALSFAGTLSGAVTIDASNLIAVFNSPVTRQLTLGGHVYSVTVSPSAIDLPAPGGEPAQINALVSVSNRVVVDPQPPVRTPEPSSLALGAIALSVAGLAARRRLRRQAAAG